MFVASWHVPRPLHVRPVTAVDWPLGHDGAAHDVLASYSRQAPLPSHLPSVPQLAAPWSEHRFITSVAPAATLLHTPFELPSAHDLQTPEQADSQQTPCSQKLERHS